MVLSWRKIRNSIESILEIVNKETNSSLCDTWGNGVETVYYAGGTLFIDYSEHPNIGLNLNGRGFAYKNGKQITFVMPKDAEENIRKLYLKVKGVTSHYSEVVGNV